MTTICQPPWYAPTRSQPCCRRRLSSSNCGGRAASLQRGSTASGSFGAAGMERPGVFQEAGFVSSSQESLSLRSADSSLAGHDRDRQRRDSQNNRANKTSVSPVRLSRRSDDTLRLGQRFNPYALTSPDTPLDCLWSPARFCFMRPEPVSASASPFDSRTDRVRTSYRHAIGLLLLAVSGCSPLATPRDSSASTYALAWAWDVDKDADDFLAVIDVDCRSATYGQVFARCRRRAGAARTTSNTRWPRASFSLTRSKRGTRSSSTSATQCTRVCTVTSAMRDHIPIHTVSPARRAALCSPPIKVSPPITAQRAGWLNWTTVGECSEPRAQQILSIGICAHTVWPWSPNSTALSQRRPTCTESRSGGRFKCGAFPT